MRRQHLTESRRGWEGGRDKGVITTGERGGEPPT